MKAGFTIEAIPGLAAWLYSRLVARSPVLADLYRQVAEEACLAVPSGRVLDVGTGPGELPLEIAARSRQLEITGVDLSTAMVNIANRRARDAGLAGRVRFEVANCAALPLPDESFELVVSTASLHHWSRPAECLREIHRVLKQGGQAWIYDIRRDLSRDAVAEFRGKYGWWFCWPMVAIAKLHSRVTRRWAEAVLWSAGLGPPQGWVEDRGVFLRLRLRK